MRGPRTVDIFLVPSLFMPETFVIVTELFNMAFLGHNSNAFHLQLTPSIIPARSKKHYKRTPRCFITISNEGSEVKTQTRLDLRYYSIYTASGEKHVSCLHKPVGIVR